MKLKAHLEQAERGAAATLASRLAVSPVMVSQWSSGKKLIPPNRAAAIEAATGGSVRRWDCRPDDWFLIWPELIGQKGAPAVTTKKAA